LKIPVACITDRDILPDCAPAICIKSDYSDKAKWPKRRKWKVESEITDKKAYLDEIKNKSEGQYVKVYIPEHWTLEYELASSGLAVDMLNVISEMRAAELKETDKEELLEEYTGKYATYNTDEEKASYIYSFFRKKYISKAEFAQYFSVYIEEKYANKAVNEMEEIFPKYLVEAIKYVTSTLTV
jgi:putative ATP-dependent endonuclease of OLD family